MVVKCLAIVRLSMPSRKADYLFFKKDPHQHRKYNFILNSPLLVDAFGYRVPIQNFKKIAILIYKCRKEY